MRPRAKPASDPIATVRNIVERPRKTLLPNWRQKSSTSQYPCVRTVWKLWSDGSAGQMRPSNSMPPSSGSSAISSMLYTGVSDQIRSATGRSQLHLSRPDHAHQDDRERDQHREGGHHGGDPERGLGGVVGVVEA